jgi:enamine deaminase RidA (YjgF/YER057c/UK114 family)
MEAAMRPDEITFVAPPGAIRPTGPWSLAVRAGDFTFVAGMRGIDPATNQLVDGEEARVRAAFRNMQIIVEAAGGTLRDAVRLVVYVTDMDRHRPLVNKVQEELWSGGPYPPRTIVEVSRLNQDDIVEVEGTFYCPRGASAIKV